MQVSENSIFESNLHSLQRRYPGLAARVMDYPSKADLVTFTANDGGIAYAIRTADGIQPLTDPITPLTRIGNQLEANSDKLNDFSIPVMIIGTYPGDEITYIFGLCEKAAPPHAQQNIYVCIDSLPCFCAFLKTLDARQIIDSDRVTLFWHEDVESFAAVFESDPSRSCLFTLVSGSLNGTVNRILAPFIKLVQTRSAETARLMAENEAYYNTLSNEALAARLTGRSIEPGPHPETQKPRLLTLTSTWSSVTQYSTRDLCAALQAGGWDIRWLNVDETPTAYYIVKQINEFKPDVFLFINHLRIEAPSLYPRNMMFVTWIQDAVPLVNNTETASKWNMVAGGAAAGATNAPARDLIIGYVDQLRKYGYRGDRLVELPMIVNRTLFRPRNLTAEQKAQYGCDIMLASNTSRPSEEIVKDILVPEFAGLKGKNHATLFPISLLMLLNDHLWVKYRAGFTFTDYGKLETELCRIQAFAEAYGPLGENDQDHVIQTLFWRLNNTIYRQVVLEWLDEVAGGSRKPAAGSKPLKLILYGKGWETHPRFARYARGELAHGEELSTAYQAARFCLHLNAAECPHQRLDEILASGATPLTRWTRQASAAEPPAELMQRVAAEARGAGAAGLPEPGQLGRELGEWLFDTVADAVRANGKDSGSAPFPAKAIQSLILSRNDWTIPGWSTFTFSTKEELYARIR